MKTTAVIYSVNKLFNAGEIDNKGFIDLAVNFGLDAVDLMDVYIPGENASERKTELEKIAGYAREKSMPVASYLVHNDFTRTETFEEELKKVEQAIAEAKILSAGNLRILGGSTHLLDKLSREEGLKNIINGLKKAAELAEEANILLVLENHGDLPGTADELSQVIEGVASPQLKICFDMGNFIAGNMSVKQEPLESLQQVIENVAHVHVKDRKFKPGARGDVECCVIGTGAVPMTKCLEMLSKFGYTGYVSVECEGEPGLGNLTAFMNSVANVKSAIERLDK